MRAGKPAVVIYVYRYGMLVLYTIVWGVVALVVGVVDRSGEGILWVARNINEGGLFVETDAPPALGTSVALEFQIPGSDEPIQVMGRVVRVSDGSGKDGPGMGIEFENLDNQSRDLINDLVRQLRVGSRDE
jgi:uncharacterized protein (TIGR02266 family)